MKISILDILITIAVCLVVIAIMFPDVSDEWINEYNEENGVTIQPSTTVTLKEGECYCMKNNTVKQTRGN